LYRQHPDPWGYTSSWYEQRKYAITVACLPRRRYRRAFEPGCSIGVLTELLAARTDALISADFAATAVEHAKHRLV
jgi:trans-aconitate methyltransferase